MSQSRAIESIRRLPSPSTWARAVPFAGPGCALVVLCCLLPLLLGTSCKRSSEPQAANADVLATVGDESISVVDFEQEIERRRSQRRPIPAKDELLEQMIAHLTLVQRAKQAGLQEDPEVVRTYHNVLIGKLREKELTATLEGTSVEDSEIRAEYERDIARYTKREKVRMALLFLATPPKVSESKVAELEARLTKARALVLETTPEGRGFGKLAISHSEDQTTRYKGGDIGWVDVGRSDYRWPAEVLRVGEALENPGELSDVIRTGAGFYLVMKLDSREGSVTSFEKARAAIRQRLLTEKRRTLEQTFRDESRALAGVEKFPEILTSLEVGSHPGPLTANQDSAPPTLPQ